MMNRALVRRFALVAAVLLALVPALGRNVGQAQATRSAAPAKPSETWVLQAPIPTRVLAQSPAETATELQIICLFRSEASNTLHGSVAEINEKLKGLLEEIRGPNLFGGELGETLLLKPPAGSLGAKRLLLIGLGDSGSFTPKRMEFVGSIVYREAVRLGVAHPYFAPTVLDGGVTKFATGEISEQFVAGFLRAARTDKRIRDAGAAQSGAIESLTFLAGSDHVSGTVQGIEKAIAAETARVGE